MKFIIATGGTGGHLFPALKVADELNRQGHTIILLGSFDRAKEQMINCGYPFEELGSRGIVFALRKEMFVSMFAMFKAINKAHRFLKYARPDAVVGFGGYGAFPVMLAATIQRYPTLIHEQNVVPGRANALLSKFVKRVAVSFKKSMQYFDLKKTVLTGCPCRTPLKDADRIAIKKTFGLKPHLKTILVFGGSQGSHHINEVFAQAASELKDHYNMQVIHVTGKQDYQKLKGLYNQIRIPFALFEFLDKMEEAYHAADLVISRSGAATVSEIAGFQLPAIFVPYPFARGHQKDNAAILREAETIRVIEDKDLSTLTLKKAIKNILEISNKNAKSSKLFKDICFSDAAERLAREAISLKI